MPRTLPRSKSVADATAAEQIAVLNAGVDRLIGEMSATKEAVRLRGCEAKPATGGTAQILSSSAGRLMGACIVATAVPAGGAVLVLTDGDGGDQLGAWPLPAAGAGVNVWFAAGGVAATRGIIATVTDLAGATISTARLSGAFYIAPA